METDVVQIEGVDEEHDNVCEGKVVDGQGFTMGDEGEAADADQGGGSYSACWCSDEQYVCPDGSDGEHDDVDRTLFPPQQQDEQLKDDADVQSADCQHMAGSRDGVDVLGFL